MRKTLENKSCPQKQRGMCSMLMSRKKWCDVCGTTFHYDVAMTTQ